MEIGCGLVWVLVKVDWVGVWLGAHLVKGTFGDVLENPHYLSCLDLLQLEKKTHTILFTYVHYDFNHFCSNLGEF